jgi:hypothetical protein
MGKPLINFISASHAAGSTLEMNLIGPMYKINQYSLAGLSLPKKTVTICCCNALLITKGHKATVEKNKEIHQRDDAPDLAADPLLFCSVATRGCA